MSVVTALSPTDVPPKLSEDGPHIPGGPGAKPKHELYLDLQAYTWDPRPVEVPRGKDDPEFLLAIRDAIFKSRQSGGVPIDAVHITCCSANGPNLPLWKALADAQPSHLEMVSGWDETCNYAGLSKVQPPWNLKSMYMGAYEGNGNWDRHLEDATQQQHSFPACYASLETLVLDYPSGHYLYFYPVGGATNLKSLTIMENDAAMVFARTVDCNPKLVETLKALTLGCHIPSEAESVRRMKRFLKEAKRLAILELDVEDRKIYPMAPDFKDEDTLIEVVPLSFLEGGAGPSNSSIAHQVWADLPEFIEGTESPDERDEDGDDGDLEAPIYTGLTKVLPNTLQSFSLSGPANSIMLKELDEWILRARDQSWLPNLRSIAFRLIDPNLQGGTGGAMVYLTQKEKEKLEQKTEQLLNILKQRSPPVEVVEPRPSLELRYPFIV